MSIKLQMIALWRIFSCLHGAGRVEVRGDAVQPRCLKYVSYPTPNAVPGSLMTVRRSGA
jgi:hypothetical protein